MAADRRQYFAPVMLAYRGDLVGIENSAFKKIQASKKFDAMQCEKSFRQICETEVQSPETALFSQVMNGQHRFERQALRMHKYRYQRWCPIVHVQNLHLRRQSPGQLQRCLTQKNETRRVIFVGLAALTVDAWSIKKFVAANEKQLHATGTASFEVFGDVSFVAHLNIDSYPTVLLFKCAILSNFAVIRQCHADLVPALAQLARQRIHHVDQRSGALQRRSLRANHQNSHSMFSSAVLPNEYSRLTHSRASSRVRSFPSSC